LKRSRLAGEEKRRRRWPLVVLIPVLAAWGGASVYYHLTPLSVPSQVFRVVVAPIIAHVDGGEISEAARLREPYWVGSAQSRRLDAVESWRRLEGGTRGIHVFDVSGAGALPVDLPFVYESPDAPYLRELVQAYALRDVITGAPDEYSAMLRLGAWLGGLFDHGADALRDRQNQISPVEVIRAGKAGKRYWCEVAARLTVHAATALGWQARLVTASRTGYIWDHAVAELWSNQFRRWFVLDTDFNVIYETDGVPLSAFELCLFGRGLQQAQRLVIRQVAPPKPSLPPADLVPYYAYVHIDMRNDWNSRFLRAGSPVGGDLSTWWTARPTMGPVLTAKVRVNRQDVFNWLLNVVSMHALGIVDQPGGARQIRVGLTAYSPSFKTFEVAVDDGPWSDEPTGEALVPANSGHHTVRARVMTKAGFPGPVYQIGLEIVAAAGSGR